MKNSILVFCIIFSQFALAQKNLILISNERIPISKISVEVNQIEIVKDQTDQIITFNCDSVYGYGQELYERSLYLKQNPENNEVLYIFLKRLVLGKISVFENEGGGQVLYLEKDGLLKKIYKLTDKKFSRYQGFDTFRSFVEDDSESVAYISAPGFKYKWKEIVKVIKYYNNRSFGEHKSRFPQIYGKVYLYRTKFQKTDEAIKIGLNGEDHDLYIEDYIILSLPVDYASKLEIRDAYVNSEHIMSGELVEQYFEVLYDSKANTFRFDKKDGTELRYEFYKIRDKVGDRITHD